MASGDRPADDFELGGGRARSVSTVEADTERHLDEALRPHGYHCLHDCRWPGTRNAIDHVVIGPSGVWIVDDTRLTGALTVDGAGELWSGRFPLSSELAKARGHAVAVDTALGRDGARAVLSVAGVDVPGGSITRDRMVVASALWATSNVIMRGRAQLQTADIEHLATTARIVLAPQRAAGPVSMRAPKASPTPTREVVAPRATAPQPAPPQPSRRRIVRRATSRWLRVVALVVLAWIAVGVFSAAYRAVRDAIGADVVPATSPLAGAPISIDFECRNPTRGWTAVASWPRLGARSVASWSANPEGPWVDVATFGASAARDGIEPGDRVLVRVGGSTAAGRAPAHPC